MTTTDPGADGAQAPAPATPGELEHAPLDSASLNGVGDDVSAGGAPMVGIAIRLPVVTLDAARAIAHGEGVKVTAMLREWIDQRVAERVDDEQVVAVADLRRLIAHRAHAPLTAVRAGDDEPPVGSGGSASTPTPVDSTPSVASKAKLKEKSASRSKAKGKSGSAKSKAKS
jgi:hypothetical protein